MRSKENRDAIEKQEKKTKDLIYWVRFFYSDGSYTLGGPEKGRFLHKNAITFCLKNFLILRKLSSFTSDSSGQLDIFGHDGNSLSVDSAQVGVLEQTDQVSFRSFLESHDSRRLESEIGFEVLGDFSDQSLEWQFSDQEFGGFLIPSDFSEGNGTGSKSVGLLDTAGGWGGFSGSFGGQLFSGSFSTGGFSSSLFGSSHFWFLVFLVCLISMNTEKVMKKQI